MTGWERYRRRSIEVLCLVAACIYLIGCDTGVEASPDPGVLRVTLQADPEDTQIRIGKDEVTASPGDHFPVTIFQGKVYRDSAYAVLFQSLEAYREQDYQYDLLAPGADGGFKQHVIFESYVPPGTYDKLQFGATATEMRIGGFVIPMALPPNTPGLMDFEQPFEIFENDTTVIHLQIKPFESVVRFRDSYHFTREFEITDIEQQ